MSFKPFRKIRIVAASDVDAKNINTMQDNIADALSQVLGKDNLDATVLRGVALSPGLNQVPHRLGRNWTGFTVTRSYGSSYFINDAPTSSNLAPALLLPLMSATAVVVDLEVF